MWNQVTRGFAGNPKIKFGDVNLAQEKIRGAPHHPGQGGWPTVRYFNKETGPDGKSYEQKTSMHMCAELGPGQPYLENLIEEVGKTSLCTTDGMNCDERAKGFLEEQKAKDPAKWKAEIDRLALLLSDSDALEEGALWIKKQQRILGQLLSEHETRTEL